MSLTQILKLKYDENVERFFKKNQSNVSLSLFRHNRLTINLTMFSEFLKSE